MSGWIRWLRSTLKGQASVSDLAGRLRAGAAAYALAEEADAVDGTGRGAQLFRVCAWNAFALQTIADTLIDVDAKTDPGTAGYVPRSTLLYANACVAAVPEWIRNARIVQGDPNARLASALPATLPKWRYDEPTQMSELRALRAAYECLQPRVESDLRATDVGEARRLFAEMTSAADYAAMMLQPHSGAVDRGEVRWRLLAALGDAFVLGQVLAMPTLTEMTLMSREREDGLPPAGNMSWLAIDTSWPVIDSDGRRLGKVHRVRGDRSTGVFEGIEIDPAVDRANLFVPAQAVARIGYGEIRLSIRQDEVRPA